MKWQPLHDNVLVKLVPVKTAGGLALPESSGEFHAIVVAVGPGKVLPNGQIVPPPVKVDDEIHITDKPRPIRDPDDGTLYAFVAADRITAIVLEPPQPKNIIVPSAGVLQ